MKRNQVNEILNTESKRKKNIIMHDFIIIILSVLTLACSFLYIDKSESYKIKYNEDSNIKYNVYLKENEFFENNYLEKDNQYIASLIDYIDASMNYKIIMDDSKADYQYSYRIESEVNVIDLGTKNSLYSYKESLLEPELKSANSGINISENIKIDYNHYNNLIKRFVSAYELDNAESTLKINMYVKVLGSCENDSGKETKITLSIPLTTKTVAVDISSNLVDNSDEILLCRETSNNAFIFFILTIAFGILDVLVVIKLFNYILLTISSSSIYEKELKKILDNYSSYIQKINSNINFDNYEIVKVDTFTDMLEIRDTIQQPILMIEDKENFKTKFIIPSKNNLMYMFVLKIKNEKIK